MSTKFVVVLTAVILVAMVAIPVVAEEVYRVPAVVVSYEMTSFGDLEVEVVDAEGNVWAYFADEAHIGEMVILTVFDFEDLSYEDDEIVDVVIVGRLDTHEMMQWLSH